METNAGMKLPQVGTQRAKNARDLKELQRNYQNGQADAHRYAFRTRDTFDSSRAYKAYCDGYDATRSTKGA